MPVYISSVKSEYVSQLSVLSLLKHTKVISPPRSNMAYRFILVLCLGSGIGSALPSLTVTVSNSTDIIPMTNNTQVILTTNNTDLIPTTNNSHIILPTNNTQVTPPTNNTHVTPPTNNTHVIPTTVPPTTVAPTTNAPVQQQQLAEPLYLTPLIEAGDLEKARLLSQVQLDGFNVTSYSGIITINADANTNMFFWFFPSADGNPLAPLLIWLNGGPHSSSLESIFGDSGPYAVCNDSTLQPRESDWTATNNVLYLDASIGLGLSSTTSDTEYPQDSSEVAKQVYKCLLQFFSIFQEQQKNSVYIVGKSYAGNFAQTLAYYIQMANSNSPIATQLKGIILLSGLREPMMDLTPANYLYQVGLVNERQVMYFKQLTDYAAEAIQAGAYEEANNILVEQTNQLKSATGLHSDLDIMRGLAFPQIYDYARDLINDSTFRNAIHVGSLPFNNLTEERYSWLMLQDRFKSYDDTLEFLLDNNYNVLVLGGQFDAKYNPAVTDQAISQLNWKWTKDYFGAPRKMILNDANEVMGYVTTLQNLCYVTLRKAAHYLTVDQPAAVLKVVYGFTRNETFYITGPLFQN